MSTRSSWPSRSATSQRLLPHLWSGAVGDDRWNHNIHLHRVVLDAVPPGAQRALDVGCGEGMLSRDLHETVPEVVGLDLHEPSLDLARAQSDGDGITWVLGDVLDHPFEPASFDVVASIAALHHMDTVAGLEAMRDLLRPGGVLVVVGLARTRFPRDLGWQVAGAVSTRWLKLSPKRTYWEHSAPIVWPPPDTYAGLRAIAERVLPGVAYRRHVLWRYSLVWTKPDLR
ncbi:MAG TPA: class I SAM-dependent methyltransferase [Acidimicrobiaceae bacterium]|nr:class I SAM-dependent methyltransferase [Acidimicrobiaceae bacterium]